MFNPKWEIFKGNIIKRKSYFLAWNIPFLLGLIMLLYETFANNNSPYRGVWLGFFFMLLSSSWIAVPDVLFSEKTAKKVLLTVLIVWLLLFSMLLIPLLQNILL